MGRGNRMPLENHTIAYYNVYNRAEYNIIALGTFAACSQQIPFSWVPLLNTDLIHDIAIIISNYNTICWSKIWCDVFSLQHG